MSEKKQISRDTYMQAFGLFSLMSKHYQRGADFEKELCELLGYDDAYAGHLSDACFGNEKTFDETLALEGFEIADAVHAKREEE